MKDEMLELVKNDRFAEYVGIELVEIEEGYAKTKVEITDDHLNGVDMVQGGLIFTLADYAFAAASNSRGLVTVGINANISYFNSPQGQFLFAEAQELSSSNRLCDYEVNIFDENDNPIAKFNGKGYKKGRK